MPLSGVRISWLMVARNAERARIAASAVSRAWASSACDAQHPRPLAHQRARRDAEQVSAGGQHEAGEGGHSCSPDVRNDRGRFGARRQSLARCSRGRDGRMMRAEAREGRDGTVRPRRAGSPSSPAAMAASASAWPRGLAAAGASVVSPGAMPPRARRRRRAGRRRAAFVAADVTRKDDCAALVAETVRALRPARHPGQQRRHVDPQAAAGLHRGRVAHGDGHQPDQRLPVLPGRPPGDGARGRRQDHQHRLDDVDLRRALRRAVRGQQGRHRAADTKAIATAWAKDNIQVNAVLPGWIDTDLTADGARPGRRGCRTGVVARTPAGRWGVPDDLAGIAVFLASRASDFVTGDGDPGRWRLFGARVSFARRATRRPRTAGRRAPPG